MCAVRFTVGHQIIDGLVYVRIVDSFAQFRKPQGFTLGGLRRGSFCCTCFQLITGSQTLGFNRGTYGV